MLIPVQDESFWRNKLAQEFPLYYREGACDYQGAYNCLSLMKTFTRYDEQDSLFVLPCSIDEMIKYYSLFRYASFIYPVPAFRVRVSNIDKSRCLHLACDIVIMKYGSGIALVQTHRESILGPIPDVDISLPSLEPSIEIHYSPKGDQSSPFHRLCLLNSKITVRFFEKEDLSSLLEHIHNLGYSYQRHSEEETVISAQDVYAHPNIFTVVNSPLTAFEDKEHRCRQLLDPEEKMHFLQ